MQVSFRLTVNMLVILISGTAIGEIVMSEVEGQVEIPNITQREEQPESIADADDSLESSQPEEQMAMKALFSPTGQLYGFGLNVNNGSVLCPSNSCEFTFDEGILRQDDEGEYILEGNLRVNEKEGSNPTASYKVEADMKVKEILEQGSNTTTLMTGFFDVYSDKQYGYVHYYIYNGTLTNHPEELTMILQGKVLPKRT